MKRDDFMPLIMAALNANGGSLKISEVCEFVWINYNARISMSQVLYTWQYDIRWAANKLRRQNKIKSDPRGSWTII